ncbi:MAG: ABC transporter substrate-binding protein [Cellulosilyticaceae bacterium]
MKIKQVIALAMISSILASTGCSSGNDSMPQKDATESTGQTVDVAEQNKQVIKGKIYTMNGWSKTYFDLAVEKWEKSQSLYKLEYPDEMLSTVNTQSLQKISTAILSGKDVDLIDITDLPYETYIEKGAFYPIELDEEILEGLYPNIRKICERDGELMMVPTAISFPILLVFHKAGEEIAQKIDLKQCNMSEFLAFAEETQKNLPEGSALIPKGTAQYFQDYVMQLFYHETIGSNESITKENLEELFSLLDTIKSWEHPSYDVSAIWEKGEVAQESIYFMPGYYNNFTDDKFFKLYPMPMSDEGYYYGTPTELFATASDSNQEGVNDLLNYLAGEEEQVLNISTFALPVNGAYTTEYKEAFYAWIGGGYDYGERQVELLELLMGRMQGFGSTELHYKALGQQARDYLGGKQTKEEAITAIIRYMELNAVK